MSLILAAFVLGVVAVVAYIIKVPMPNNFSKPVHLRSMLMVIKLVLTCVGFIIWFGNKSRAEQYRNLLKKGKKLTSEDTKGLQIRETTFDGVKVTVFLPEGETTDTKEGHHGMLFFHGGGWVLGNSPNYDVVVARFAREANAIVVSVDYRLAPEHIFPAAFQDCLAATKYFLRHAREFGADPERVAICGDSAGGNLAAGIAIKLRDEKFQPVLKRQVLVYPALQALDFNTPSMVQNEAGPILPRELMVWFWSLYLCGSDKYVNDFTNNKHTTQEIRESKVDHNDVGTEYKYMPYVKPKQGYSNDELWDKFKSILTNPAFAPLMAGDFSVLPEACIITCQCDVLRDDGLLYAKYLKEAGVKVSHINIKSGFHGVMALLECSEKELIKDTIVSQLQNMN